MSRRPYEILNLKIKDIMFKKTEDGNRQNAAGLMKWARPKSSIERHGDDKSAYMVEQFLMRIRVFNRTTNTGRKELGY